MRNIILHQREERDRLLSLPYINRQTIYPVDVLLQSPMIKLITGPRRVKCTQKVRHKTKCRLWSIH